MSKIKIHQLLFIITSLVIIYVCATTYAMPFSSFNVEAPDVRIAIVVVSLILIGTIGVAHGALDGKIIWEYSNRYSVRLKLYSIYLLLTFSGALLWFLYPLGGLAVLLIMSSFHFGVSDLKFFKNMHLSLKLYWGFAMTFLPLLFKEEIVSGLFFDLTSIIIYPEIIYAIRIMVVLSITLFFLSMLVIRRTDIDGNSSELKLLCIEMVLLIILAYYLNPLIWFSLYFCGLHGLRAIIDSKFKIIPDLIWLFLFTAPVSLIIFLIDWDYDFNSLLIVFPILASLTVAHMLLPSIKDYVKP